MNLFPFVISQTIRMLLNVLWSPKAGLLVDICLLWSYDLYDYQLAPWLRKSHVANLHALQSASGAQRGKSGQQMSLRIFRCRHRSPNSLSFLRFQKLGLVCYEKCCVLPLCPFSASITAPNSFVIRRFFKPQPKLRECFIKIKKWQGKASFVSSEHFTFIYSLWENEAMSPMGAYDILDHFWLGKSLTLLGFCFI